jgi:hypothetical protein
MGNGAMLKPREQANLEGGFNGSRELFHAPEQRMTGCLIKLQLFCCHRSIE